MVETASTNTAKKKNLKYCCDVCDNTVTELLSLAKIQENAPGT